jgi:integrase
MKTEARTWFAENVAPRLRRGSPSNAITYNDFADLYLDRHGATVMPRTKETIEERLGPSREQFGTWTLAELENAAADVAAWRAGFSEGKRYRATLAFRQTLAAAVRWGHITRNPVADAGKNPEPRRKELLPFTADEIDSIAEELDTSDAAMVVVAAETGLRTHEWLGLERSDVHRVGNAAIVVQRRVVRGVATPYPKTDRSRRRVPLTSRALEALTSLPPRIDTPLLFPAPKGGPHHLDTWRSRTWYAALTSAGVDRRGPYHLRHTFATEALAAGVSIFELSRLMGASVKEIDRTYGHLAHDSEDAILARLEARSRRSGVEVVSG